MREMRILDSIMLNVLVPTPAASTGNSSRKQYNPNAPDWIAPEAQEFVPQSYNSVRLFLSDVQD